MDFRWLWLFLWHKCKNAIEIPSTQQTKVLSSMGLRVVFFSSSSPFCCLSCAGIFIFLISFRVDWFDFETDQTGYYSNYICLFHPLDISSDCFSFWQECDLGLGNYLTRRILNSQYRWWAQFSLHLKIWWLRVKHTASYRQIGWITNRKLNKLARKMLRCERHWLWINQKCFKLLEISTFFYDPLGSSGLIILMMRENL